MKPITAAIILISLTLAPAAAGFGKNKVQYRYMHWNTLEGPHYTLYYHQDQGALPDIAFEWLGDMYRDLGGRFGFAHRAPVPVVLYESPALFEQTNIITEILPEEVGGFTELFKNRIAVPFNGSFGELRHVLHHEMVHAFVFGVTFNGSIFRAAASQAPLWFNEGLAEVLSSGWNREADMFMLDRLLHSTVPPPGPMLNGYMAYKGGQSFLYYLHSTGGDSLFNRMLSEFRETGAAEKSIETIYKKTIEDLGKDWISELRRIYWPEIGRRMEPAEHAGPITVHTKDKSRFNTRPRISPDGKSIAFYSDRKDYVRIIITDTTGKELKRISQHSLSGGSFESFQPMSGAMAWSPDSRELAFVAKKGGQNEIRIVNAKTGKTREVIRLPLSAITGLDWSRDGNKLAMTAISYGQADLYLYDINSFELAILVDSPESKASPRFSPDGKKIIYAATDTAGLGTGPFSPIPKSTSNIAVFDIENDSSYLLTDTEWNDKQPVFSPDGNSFIFVSDRNGIDNLYIAALGDPDNPHPLTDYTGSCGNPDWAGDGSAIVYDNFQNQAWNIWRMAEPEKKTLKAPVLALTRWAEFEEGTAEEFFRKKGAAGAPGAVAKDTKDTNDIKDTSAVLDVINVVNVLNDSTDSTATTAADTTPTPKPYRLRFTPDLVIFGLGISTYSGASGQALAAFSDIMGDHRITLVGDVQMDFSEYAQVYAAYQYLKLRAGLTVGGFYYKYYSYDGLFRRYFHDLETGGFAGVSYPFSVFSRADASLFGRYMRRTPVSSGPTLDGNAPLLAILEDNALLAQFGYTFDNILWGITGPLNGLRGSAQLHIAPPLPFTGEAYISADIDARHYTHIFRRYVWANRLTAGITAGLDGNRAARRFFLGGNENWFNYGVNYEKYDENLPYSYYSDIVSPLRGWDYFDITGDRMLLANSEFRFPFIREISTVWPIPMQIRYINGALFIDAGYAWTEEEQTSSLPLPPKIAGGYGFGMRANLGIFVLRYDRGWPTDWRSTGRPINYFSLGAEF